MIKKRIKKIERCIVPANTLVIADTTGYHSRGLSKKFSKRYQLHFRVRRNPFSQILIN